MNKNQLAEELIKMLEMERGAPVQLTVDTLESVKYKSGDGKEYFGDFYKRPATVRRTQNLNPRYEHDVALLEGSYRSLSDLGEKTNRYNVLYRCDGNAIKAYELVAYILGDSFLPLADNFHVKGFREGACKILDENGIVYLQHKIVARPDGLFHDRTNGGTLTPVDEVKIADIVLELK